MCGLQEPATLRCFLPNKMSFDFFFADFLENGADPHLFASDAVDAFAADLPWIATSSTTTSEHTTTSTQQPTSATATPLSPDMQAVYDAATRKLHALQLAATACQFALCDGFLAALQTGSYSKDTKVFVCVTHARPSFPNVCTYVLASAKKAKSHAMLAAKAAAEAATAPGPLDAAHVKKRHRAGMACDACRVGKRRCERARGAASCTHCATRGVACVWSGDAAADNDDDDHDGDDDDDDNDRDAVRTTSVALSPLAGSTPTVFSDALLEELGFSDDVGSYATIKMPSGVPQMLLLPIRSVASFVARQGKLDDGTTIVNMNEEFCALTGMSRAELQFSPVDVVFCALSESFITESIEVMQQFMSVPSNRHVAKTPMQLAISVRGSWYACDTSLTVVMRNRLPSLYLLTVDRVQIDQPPIVPFDFDTPNSVPPDVVDRLGRHKEFVAKIVKDSRK
jgi:hypothetical protein